MEWSHQAKYTTVVPLPLIELPANINLSPAQAIHHGGIIAFGMSSWYTTAENVKEQTKYASSQIATRLRRLQGTCYPSSSPSTFPQLIR
jgi:hypothetical protein